MAALATLEDGLPVTISVVGDRNRLNVVARTDFLINVERDVVDSSIKVKSSSLQALGIVVVVFLRFLSARMVIFLMTVGGQVNEMEREVSDVRIRYLIHCWEESMMTDTIKTSY